MRGIAALLLIASAVGAEAADIKWVDPIEGEFFAPYPMVTVGDRMPAGGPVALDGPHLRVEGDIERGDNARLQELLRAELPDFNRDMFNDVVVSFDSDGGDFYEGLDISDTLDRFAVATYVGPGDRCLSSCAIAWLGGMNVKLRGLPKFPARYLHAEAIVGFHAPFTELGKTLRLTSGEDVNGAVIADEFYAMARFAISELAARIEQWQVAPDFVFQLLSKGPPAGSIGVAEAAGELAEQFVLVEDYARLDQTAATLLVRQARYPAQIGLIDALQACQFVHVYNRNLGNERGYDAAIFIPGNTGSLVNETVVAEGDRRIGSSGHATFSPIETSGSPYPRIRTKPGPASGVGYRSLLPADSRDSYFFKGIEAGLGPVGCNVFRADGDAWYVKSFNENIHFVDARTGEKRPGSIYANALDADGGLPVNDFTRLGNRTSWLRPVAGLAERYSDLPGELTDITGASFDCGGDLDPAAEVICRHPALARLDGAMGALYSDARSSGLQVREGQRKWFGERNRACRPEQIDMADPFAEANLAVCLAHYTRFRISELSETLSR